MELPEVESIFDVSRSIYCLKPKGSHVGLSGNEIEEAACRCNSHKKLVNTLKKFRDECDDNNHNKHHKEFHRMCRICVIDEALLEVGEQK